jgi:hypothetical protein
MTYEKELKRHQFNYNEERRDFKKALVSMVDLLRWQLWAMLFIATLLLASFIGIVAYMLVR